jgi:beta-lactamase regulating signal transducer with metallopeptidase domain
MRTIEQLLLTFLLNSFWQVALVALVAALCARLLRGAALRHRHLIWVLALGSSLCLPVLTSALLSRNSLPTAPTDAALDGSTYAGEVSFADAPAQAMSVDTSVRLNRRAGALLLALYVLLLLWRGVKLFRALRRTRSISQSARAFEFDETVRAILARSQRAFGVTRVRVLCSERVRVPVTVGVLKPLVILPDALARGREADLLTSAIGHELAHVARRDYLFNLLYEIIFLPLSFHPAAALVRRRIVQTRELICDESVAERLLSPEVYARSLLQLAGSAKPFGSRAGTVSVGVSDADILEVRIMSLLKKTTLKVRGNRTWLVAAALLLAVPCAAAGAFATRFTVESLDSAADTQEQSAGQNQQSEEQARRERREKEEAEMKERAARDPQFRAELEARERRGREEREIRVRELTELARLAKISMDQAIQIATAQQPGKVLECSLTGEHWESPGKLAADGLVLYHVVILSGDASNPTRAQVLVNAVDGTIFRSEVEGRRDDAKREQP